MLDSTLKFNDEEVIDKFPSIGLSFIIVKESCMTCLTKSMVRICPSNVPAAQASTRWLLHLPEWLRLFL